VTLFGVVGYFIRFVLGAGGTTLRRAVVRKMVYVRRGIGREVV
jgi:hypothetical protein